jgi:GTP cyclohydrolase II
MAAKGAQPLAAVTHERGETLKIRLYTPDVVAVPLALNGDPLGRAAVLADPSADLTHPLGGPYQALRDLEGRPLAAAVKVAKVAGLLPAVLALDLDTADEGAARSFAAQHRLSFVSEAAAAAYDLGIAETLALVTRAKVPLEGAEQAEIAVFRSDAGGPEHYAVIIGELDAAKPVLARIHSECFTGDLLGSLKCDCGDQLRGAVKEISEAGAGVLLYLAQEGRGIGLPNKMRAYRLQDQGYDTVEANTRLGFEVDERFFEPAAKMLELLGVKAVRLMTNNPEKVKALEALGVPVAERVAHKFASNRHNVHYLLTKRAKTGHLL